MCWSVDTPEVTTVKQTVPATALVSQTESETPEAPELGGTEDTFNARKGRKQLTIQRNAAYNPSNMNV